MSRLHRITPCLWFDDQAEAAADYYIGIFPSSQIVAISRYGEAGHEIHGRQAGTVMTVEFTLDGQPFTALNGGPHFTFNEAVSLQVGCDSQEEIDYYWEKLGAGGDPRAQQCGWLKDRYGLSWQVVPNAMAQWMVSGGDDRAANDRIMTALLQMKKLDIAVLERARAGK